MPAWWLICRALHACLSRNCSSKPGRKRRPRGILTGLRDALLPPTHCGIASRLVPSEDEWFNRVARSSDPHPGLPKNRRIPRCANGYLKSYLKL